MSVFDDREKAFEIKYVHDEELKFRATARRNKLFGLWAAGRMGYSETDASAYARTVVNEALSRVGDESVVHRVAGDLTARGVPVPDHEIRNHYGALMAVALLEVQAEA